MLPLLLIIPEPDFLVQRSPFTLYPKIKSSMHHVSRHLARLLLATHSSRSSVHPSIDFHIHTQACVVFLFFFRFSFCFYFILPSVQTFFFCSHSHFVYQLYFPCSFFTSLTINFDIYSNVHHFDIAIGYTIIVSSRASPPLVI